MDHRSHITGPGLPAPHGDRDPLAPLPFDAAGLTADPTFQDAEHSPADPVSVPRVLKRLAIAAILIAALSVLFWVVLPSFGLMLHPLLPALSVIAIAAGTLLTARDAEDSTDTRTPRDGCDDDARPIGCCPGPRPPRGFRD